MNRKATRLAKMRQWQIMFQVDDDGMLRCYAVDRATKQQFALPDHLIITGAWAGVLTVLQELADRQPGIIPPPGAAG